MYVGARARVSEIPKLRRFSENLDEYPRLLIGFPRFVGLLVFYSIF